MSSYNILVTYNSPVTSSIHQSISNEKIETAEENRKKNIAKLNTIQPLNIHIHTYIHTSIIIIEEFRPDLINYLLSENKLLYRYVVGMLIILFRFNCHL